MIGNDIADSQDYFDRKRAQYITGLQDKIDELQARVASMLDVIVEKNKKIGDLETELRTADDIINKSLSVNHRV